MKRLAYTVLVAGAACLLAIGVWAVADAGSASGAADEPEATEVAELEVAHIADSADTDDTHADVADILALAESARTRWTSIRVEGESGVDGDLQPFLIEVSPDGYICEDGSSTLRSDRTTCWLISSGSSEITAWPAPKTEKAAEAAARLAQAAADDPALPRPGEEPVFGHPLSDVVQPAYWVRKELGQEANKIEYLGVETVAGRPAFHLRAAFPPTVAKEKDWEVFVDRETGIILGLVINPLPGNPRYEQMVTAVTLNPTLDRGHFGYQVPEGITTRSPAGRVE